MESDSDSDFSVSYDHRSTEAMEDDEEDQEDDLSEDDEEEEVDLEVLRDEERANNNEVLVPPKRKLAVEAPVWKEAGSKLFENGVVIGSKCNFCSKKYGHNNANTSNLTKHVIRWHRVTQPEIVKRLEEAVNKKKKKKVEKKKELAKKMMLEPKLLNWVPRKGCMDNKKKKIVMKALLDWVVATDKPLSEVESHFFRNLVFKLEPNLVLPSRTSFTKDLDEAAKKARVEQKEEIIQDVDNTHKTIQVITDHGSSSDIFKTKKNAVAVAWSTKDFIIKRATTDLYKCKGSQSGLQIRKDVKNSLVEWAGWRPGWRVNWVTDGESKQLNARDPNKHADVGLQVYKTGELEELSISTFFLLTKNLSLECFHLSGIIIHFNFQAPVWITPST